MGCGFPDSLSSPSLRPVRPLAVSEHFLLPEPSLASSIESIFAGASPALHPRQDDLDLSPAVTTNLLQNVAPGLHSSACRRSQCGFSRTELSFLPLYASSAAARPRCCPAPLPSIQPRSFPESPAVLSVVLRVLLTPAPVCGPLLLPVLLVLSHPFLVPQPPSLPSTPRSRAVLLLPVPQSRILPLPSPAASAHKPLLGHPMPSAAAPDVRSLPRLPPRHPMPPSTRPQPPPRIQTQPTRKNNIPSPGKIKKLPGYLIEYPRSHS